MSKDLIIKLLTSKLHFESAKNQEKKKLYAEAVSSYTNAIYPLVVTIISDESLTQGERKQITNICLVYKIHFDHLRYCMEWNVSPEDMAPVNRLGKYNTKGIDARITHESAVKALRALVVETEAAMKAGNQELHLELGETSWAYLVALSKVATDEEKNTSDVTSKGKKKPNRKDIIAAIKKQQNTSNFIKNETANKEKPDTTEIKIKAGTKKHPSDVIKVASNEKNRRGDVQDVIFADDKVTLFPENFDFEKANKDIDLKLKQQDLSNEIRQCRLAIKDLNKKAKQSTDLLERKSFKSESEIISKKLETLSDAFEVLIDSKLKQSPNQDTVEGKKQRRKRRSQERNSTNNDQVDNDLRNLSKEVDETSSEKDITFSSKMILGISTQPDERLSNLSSGRKGQQQYIDDFISSSA